MARILSPVWSTIRGSIGGTTYLSNQWHQIVARQRTAPVNPQTSRQGVIRTGFGDGSSRWQDLTAAQRSNWNDYADTCEYQGPLGNYTVPGRQLFVGTMALVTYTNAIDPANAITPIVTAPTTPGFFSGLTITPSLPTTIPSTGIALSIENTTGETARILSARSFAFPATRNRYKGPFLSSTSKLSIINSGTASILEYTDLADGLVYFIRLRAWTPNVAHRISAEYIFKLTAVTQDL